MDFLRELLGIQQKISLETTLKLRMARFHRIQENSKKFNSLIKDAFEKQAGEFVIDNQYLNSLIEKSFNLAYEITYDMNILSNDRHYDQYFKIDRLKAKLRRIAAGQPDIEGHELVISLNELNEAGRTPPDLEAFYTAAQEHGADNARIGKYVVLVNALKGKFGATGTALRNAALTFVLTKAAEKLRTAGKATYAAYAPAMTVLINNLTEEEKTDHKAVITRILTAAYNRREEWRREHLPLYEALKK